MKVYRYSLPDPSPDVPETGADALVEELERKLSGAGDVAHAVWKMQRDGIGHDEGKLISGLRDIEQELKKRKKTLPDQLAITARKVEEQFQEADRTHDLSKVDRQLVQELLGERAAAEMAQLGRITEKLEEAGFIQKRDGRFELTPRGMRRIAQKTLGEIFHRLKRERRGHHPLTVIGPGGEQTEETRAFEFGDEFHLHLQRTIMNAVRRGRSTMPLRLAMEDFEVHRTEQTAHAATVILLDMSLSMSMYGNFDSAKRVAIALDGLIRSEFPGDRLHVVGFANRAREVRREDLYYASWDERDPHTNMHHGLSVARRLLEAERCANKQMIMISDGEPTAHVDEDGEVYYRSPPVPRTLEVTLNEVARCTRQGIRLSVFLLEGADFYSEFAMQLARVNKGRVFLTTSDRLGQYLLTDYLSGKKRGISW